VVRVNVHNVDDTLDGHQLDLIAYLHEGRLFDKSDEFLTKSLLRKFVETTLRCHS
jgi:hypothetical protein